MPEPKAGKSRWRPSYWRFVVPALVVVGAVIVFPWLFTLWMSVIDWKIGRRANFVGFDNYVKLAANQRFWSRSATRSTSRCSPSSRRWCSARSPRWSSTASFRCAACCAAIFIMPMMATPVAVALVWTMMFHPQQGVLNYLLSLVGIPPRCG